MNLSDPPPMPHCTPCHLTIALQDKLEIPAMAEEPNQSLITDPDNVPETMCDGQFNVTVAGSLATLTFTHTRRDVTAMFRDGRIVPKSVVRARIVTSMNNLTALRDLLNRIIQDPTTPVPPAGGAKH
jgi:hypothetical protein